VFWFELDGCYIWLCTQFLAFFFYIPLLFRSLTFFTACKRNCIIFIVFDFYNLLKPWALKFNHNSILFRSLYIYTYTYTYRVIHKSLRDFRPLRYRSRDGHAEGEHVNRGRDTPSFWPTLQVLDMCTLGDAADVNPVIKFLLTCSLSAWPSRLLYRRGRKSRNDLWITLYIDTKPAKVFQLIRNVMVSVFPFKVDGRYVGKDFFIAVITKTNNFNFYGVSWAKSILHTYL
jgi:hypothetical protein